MNSISMSTLNKTWVFDMDGTIVKHNGYLTDGFDTLLPGAKEYIDSLPAEDRVVIFTSRPEDCRQSTLDFLSDNHIRYDDILFNMPLGERIVVNDRKPSGLDMAYAFNLDRDCFDLPEIKREL